MYNTHQLSSFSFHHKRLPFISDYLNATSLFAHQSAHQASRHTASYACTFQDVVFHRPLYVRQVPPIPTLGLVGAHNKLTAIWISGARCLTGSTPLLTPSHSLQICGCSKTMTSTTILRNMVESHVRMAVAPHPLNPNWVPYSEKSKILVAMA